MAFVCVCVCVCVCVRVCACVCVHVCVCLCVCEMKTSEDKCSLVALPLLKENWTVTTVSGGMEPDTSRMRSCSPEDSATLTAVLWNPTIGERKLYTTVTYSMNNIILIHM